MAKKKTTKTKSKSQARREAIQAVNPVFEEMVRITIGKAIASLAVPAQMLIRQNRLTLQETHATILAVLEATIEASNKSYQEITK